MTQTKLQSRFHLDSESGHVYDRDAEEWLVTAEEVYDAMIEEDFPDGLPESMIVSTINDLDVLRADLIAKLERLHDLSPDARTIANQEHGRARAEHNEQEET